MRNKIYSSVLFLSFLSLVFLGFGCNPFQKAEDKINDKISEKVTEGILGNISGGKVDIKDEGDEVHFKDNKTGNEVAYGEDLKLPDNFPKSVPLYPGAKIKGIMLSNNEDQNATLTMGTDDAVSEVLAWYEAQAKDADWKEDQSMSFNNIETRSYSKGDERLTISISGQNEADQQTAIILGYNLENNSTDTDSEE